MADPPVPFLERPVALPRSTVRTVAFYLPQFHPIPENDVWWGRGFTEWTNVARARPLYRDHVQPRLPGELGFYDLRLVDTQRRQVELAKLYGIDAFCFYAYWFGGRRLLEAPLRQYLEHPELDLPFCICWANQNWTRRWDGSDTTVLIRQSHSADDDLAFIEHVSQYLIAPKYLRIGDRPLLLVYRPGEMPDPKATAERWRSWMRETHGIELCLAYVQGVDDVDPAVFGFDAAVEFPPLRPPGRPHSPEMSSELDPVSPEVRAVVHDWRDLARASETYAEPGYRLFRGVCPSWDNTPRRGNSASILWNSSPAGFQNWVRRSLVETEERLPPDEQLVFVNAWNEWAEGCYLEPDQHHGYAYLEAVRVASVRAAVRPRPGGAAATPILGVVVQSFSPDLLGAIERRLAGSLRPIEVLTVDDRGGDRWPFLQVLSRCGALGWDDVLHLEADGEDHLESGVVDRIVESFHADATLGMVVHGAVPTGSVGHRSPDRLDWVARRLGVEAADSAVRPLSGGTFSVRLAALAPLRALDLRDVPSPSTGDLGRYVELSVAAAGFSRRSLRDVS